MLTPESIRTINRPSLFEAPAQTTDPFGIYIHIPFCTHICPYCDFNTYSGQSDRIPAYVEAIKQEIRIWSGVFRDRVAGSIFLGGGTPSLLRADQTGELIAACKSGFQLIKDAEVTIEANPNDLSTGYCAGLIDVGVNRISIGAQSLDRRGLRVLGRMHEADAVAQAVFAARTAGLESLSLDFIYGWPGQTIESWRNDLDRILAGDIGGSPPDHLSLYSLIVEPGTPMADAVHRGILTPVEDDISADMFELAVQLLSNAGWIHYEIANWSATATAASRHNAVYWRNGDYAGIGAGAHGHAGNVRSMNHPTPRRYIELLAAGKIPTTNVESIDARTSMGETMMLGLRLLQDGVSRQSFLDRHGIGLLEQFATPIVRLHSQGLIESDTHGVRLTARGALLANAVCAEFL